MEKRTQLHSGRSIIVLIVITCLLFTSSFSMSQQADRWKDNSDDLPGFGSDTVWIILGVAAVAGAAAWLIFFNGSDDEDIPKYGKASDQEKIAHSDTTVIKDSVLSINSDTTLIRKDEAEIDSTKQK